MAGDGGANRFYTLTGQVIREWAALELALSQWLTDLLAIDELRARIIWDSYGDFRGKMNLLKTLTRNFADEGLWPEAWSVCAAIEVIAANRYILPHAFGEIDEAGKLAFFSERADGDYLVDFTQEYSVDSDTLLEWLSDIVSARERAMAFKLSLSGRVLDDSLMNRRLARPASVS